MYEMGVSRQNGGPRSLRLPITQGYVPERSFTSSNVSRLGWHFRSSFLKSTLKCNLITPLLCASARINRTPYFVFGSVCTVD